jgi:hypothetical protein
MSMLDLFGVAEGYDPSKFAEVDLEALAGADGDGDELLRPTTPMTLRDLFGEADGGAGREAAPVDVDGEVFDLSDFEDVGEEGQVFNLDGLGADDDDDLGDDLGDDDADDVADLGATSLGRPKGSAGPMVVPKRVKRPAVRAYGRTDRCCCCACAPLPCRAGQVVAVSLLFFFF